MISLSQSLIIFGLLSGGADAAGGPVYFTHFDVLFRPVGQMDRVRNL